MTTESDSCAFRRITYNLQQQRVDDPRLDSIDLTVFSGKQNELAAAIVSIMGDQFNRLLQSAERNGLRLLEVKTRWLNIPDADTNPLGDIGSVFCSGLALSREAPHPIDLSTCGTSITVNTADNELRS